MKLRAGEYVEIRSAAEIRATLDDHGCLEGLPFMPEMTAYCGTVHRVFRRIDKIIDIVQKTGLRRMTDTVTLENLRCDGSVHGGCQTGCQILWKEAWLRRCSIDDPRGTADDSEPVARDFVARLKAVAGPSRDQLYRCQATELFEASSYLSSWDLRQYLSPLLSGNVTPWEFLRVIAIELFNVVQRLRKGSVYPDWPGSSLEKTPTMSLELQPGEWVKVKTKDEILRTLDKGNRNRGLWFDREMLRYCGRPFKVLRRVDRLVQEKSGRLLQLKNPCVILEEVTARGDFYRFNPQNDYILWREIWLERLVPKTANAATAPPARRGSPSR